MFRLPKMKKIKKEIFCCILFLTALYGMWLADFLSEDRLYSDWEKRMLAQRPSPVPEDILDGSYGTAYETWLTDQFPARDWWVSLKTRCEIFLGKKEIHGIFLGKDGYLFSENTRTADWERLEQKLIAQYGSDAVSCIKAPAAGSVLTDHLPRGLSFPTEEDLVWKNLYANREKYIYYRTDHHWTMLGAYYAYEAWAESRGLIPAPLDDMKYEVVREDFLGTHYARLHYARKADAIEVYRPNVVCTVTYDLGDSSLSGLYQPELLQSEDAYRYFLDGNHPVLQIETGQPEGHLAVLKDSFANCLIPYLALHYQKITVIDPRYFRTDIVQWLETEGITEILFVYQDDTASVTDG